MSRTLSSPTGGVLRTRILQVTQGGTSGGTVSEALAGLDAVGTGSKNQANGIATLDTNLKVRQENIPSQFESGPTVNGPTVVYTRTNSTHVITNYDIATTYTVEAIFGTVKLDKGVITYAPGSISGPGGFILNGKSFGIEVRQATVEKASILTPITGAENMPASVTITSTSYVSSGGAGTHQATSWQLATDQDFTNIVQQSANDTGNLTSWTVSALAANTQFYARCKHIGSNGVIGDWSDPVSFSTRASYGAYMAQAVFLPPDGSTSSSFGSAVFVSNDCSTAVIGSEGYNNNTGAVYVYVREGSSWRYVQKLQSPTPTANDHYGYAVFTTADATYLAVGAYGANAFIGAAYIYTRSGNSWTLQAVLTPSDAPGSGWFGRDLVMDLTGNRIAVGCHGRWSRQGAVYSFYRNGTSWIQDQIITAPNPMNDDVFGLALDMSDDGSFIVVGAKQDGGAAVNFMGDGHTGFVCVFHFQNNHYEWFRTLTPSDGFKNGFYGTAVKCTPACFFIVVGAYNNGKGKAYAYRNYSADYSGGWTEMVAIPAPSGATNFGQSVNISISGEHLTIGAPGGDGLQPSVVVYDKVGETYQAVRQLILDESDVGNAFSYCISVTNSDEYMLVGARSYNNYQGAAVMYH